MADYDVAALSLSVPAASSPIATYRPAVLVRNNGIHDALASGTLHIYSAGRLLFTTEVFTATIPPGETRPALAFDYWTPPAVGFFIFLSDVTCDHDQVEPNNHMPPTTIQITSAQPPPPPPVEAHASQHEEGGADEVLIDGLHGRTADAQAPIAHKTNHQLGGSDPLNVSGLEGVLATPQPLADHHITHEYGGGDMLNIDGLHGVGYNLQKPQLHANEAHDPNFALDSALVDHKVATTAHQNRRGVASGFASLDTSTLVPSAELAPITTPPPANYVLHASQTWAAPEAIAHNTSHEDAGDDELSVSGLSGRLANTQIADELSSFSGAGGPIGGGLESQFGTLTIPPLWLKQTSIFRGETVGQLFVQPSAGQQLVFRGYFDAILQASITLSIPLYHVTDFILRARLFMTAPTIGRIELELLRHAPPAGQSQVSIAYSNNFNIPALTHIFDLRAQWLSAVPGSVCTFLSTQMHAVNQPTA